ncbi:hypothetical protein FB451DRAFT_1188215 [Mycena latifolia]|nr:hypothetical protein FB451DRAFT_1188215 [Mycena latifolia]
MTTASMLQIRHLRNRCRRLGLHPDSPAERAYTELMLILTLGPTIYEHEGSGDLYLGTRFGCAEGKVGETGDVPWRIKEYRICQRAASDFWILLTHRTPLTPNPWGPNPGPTVSWVQHSTPRILLDFRGGRPSGVRASNWGWDSVLWRRVYNVCPAVFYCPYTIQSVVDEYIYLKECVGDTELTRGFYDTPSHATHADTLATPRGAVHALLATAALGGFTNSGARQFHVGGGAGCT